MINKNYTSERGYFQKLFDRVDERRIAMQKKLIESRFKLKELMTREEWEAVITKAKEGKAG